MKAAEFCYWLQGYFEISGSNTLDSSQVEMVKRHLALVFKHELDAPDPDGILQSIHDGSGINTNGDNDAVYRC